jgi:hypothetical protein
MYMEELGCYMTKNNLIKYLMPVGVLLAFSSMANATLVLPEGGSVAATPTVVSWGAVPILDTGVQPIGAGALVGTLEEKVFTDDGTGFFGCAGCLDWVITGTVSASDLGRITANDFSNAGTAVGTIAIGGGVDPVTITRTAGVVAFNFGGILAPVTTNRLVIETNVKNFAPGFASMEDGGAQSIHAWGVTPEPNFAALMSVFAVGILGLAYRRKKNVAKNTEV